MDAKSIALIITFAALAIVLNPAISGMGIPYPLLVGLWFQVWEIPIMVAFLLFGFKIAVAAGLINVGFLLAVFPGPSQPYYPTNIIAQLGMMLGIYLASRILSRNASTDNPVSKPKLVSLSILLAILFRVTFMAPVMFGILYLDPLQMFPTTPAWYIVAIIWPPQAIFNVILPLYMIPSSYLIARLISRNMKVGNRVM